MQRTVTFNLNGKPIRLNVDDQRPLLWVLRSDMDLTGTRFGCGEALCGACTVLVDNEPVRSCAARIGDVEGKQVLTIEGLARDGRLHPLQEAFVRHNAFQCGYCTSGMLLSAYALLLKIPLPSRDQILREMDDNLCRCGSHARIVQAIQTAALALAGQPGGGR
jgi:aerobic-type carbon monoxide dehydrogenase small subunit (CoxS/CutS family)